MNQFRQESSRYVLEPGTLRYVRLISERPVVVHNTYLQYLVETGLVGTAAFGLFLIVCTRRRPLAARRFEARGRMADAYLARGVFVATLATLAAGLFFSAGVDYKTWLLLALGPVLFQASGLPVTPGQTPRSASPTGRARTAGAGPRAAGPVP